MLHRMLPILLLSGALSAQSVAFTFDDGPTLHPTPRMTPQERNEAILAQLRDRKVQGMFFVTLQNGADRPEGLALLRALGEGGQLIANHTVSHPDFNDELTTIAAFQEEVKRCDGVIQTIPGYRKFFRFPFLREGASEAKRDAVREFLRAENYRIGYVGIDDSEWLIDGKFCERLAKNPRTELAPWRAYYLDHILRSAQAEDALARRIYGREVPLVLLLHHNLLNALFLGDLIDAFKNRGWKIVSPDAAYSDTAYLVEPKTLPMDGDVFYHTAKVLGIRVKPFFKDVKSQKVTGEEAEKL